MAFPFSLGAERLRDLDLEFLSPLRDLLLLLFPDPDRDLERLRDLLLDLELLRERLLRSRERLLERLRDLSTQKESNVKNDSGFIISFKQNVSARKRVLFK